MGYDFFYHGLYMWLGWTIFAFAQVATNRYFKAKLLYVHMWIHRISGTIVLFITLYHGFKAWGTVGGGDWRVIRNWHSVFVFPTLFAVTFIAFGGIFTRSKLRRNVWSTAQALRIKRVHKYLAYFIIACGCGALMSGIKKYRTNPAHQYNDPWEYYHLLITVALFGVSEALYRRGQRKESQYQVETKVVETMTVDEFKEKVQGGAQLVILDEMVLDVSFFMDDHPGGKFSLKHNVGRDVSKFFYGGYSLENVQKVAHHAHSNDARSIVSRLCIGYIVDKTQVRIMSLSGVERQANASGNVKTFKFLKVEGNSDDYKRVKQNESPLCDITQIGRHYLVKYAPDEAVAQGCEVPKYVDNVSPNRHYTEAFCMRKNVYESLLKLAENYSDSDAMNEIRKEIDSQKADSLCLTIKNYSKNYGVSSFIHEASIQEFLSYLQIKGPMGKGLDIPTSGRNVAFTAGTGVLVFIDLVAHLILQIIGQNGGEKLQEGGGTLKSIDLSNFTFELYTAFPNENEAFTLDLIECLQKLCQKHGMPELFKHYNAMGGFYYQCFPKDGVTSEPEFFRTKFNEYNADQNVKKVWVCGPPMMQETFDHELHDYKKRNGESYSHVDYVVI